MSGQKLLNLYFSVFSSSSVISNLYYVLLLFFELIFSSIIIHENTSLAKYQTFQIKLKLTLNPSFLPDTQRKRLNYLVYRFSPRFLFSMQGYFVGFIFCLFYRYSIIMCVLSCSLFLFSLSIMSFNIFYVGIYKAT